MQQGALIAEHDAHRARPARVLCDVGESFADHVIDRHADLVGKAIEIDAAAVEIGCNAELDAPFRCIVGKRARKTEFVDGCRPQLP